MSLFFTSLMSRYKDRVSLFRMSLPNSLIWLEYFYPFLVVPYIIIVLPWKIIFSSNTNNVIKFLFILGIIVFVLLSIYVYRVSGKPDKELWQKLIKKHNESIVVKVYDNKRNMIGGLSINGLKDLNKGTFYVDKVPKLYWEILKFREDRYLTFDNSDTGIFGIFKNPRSYNGVDIAGVPISVLKGRGGSSLSQQLVKNFYGQDYFHNSNDSKVIKVIKTAYRKWIELGEARTFYHYLRNNDGEEFKRWISMHTPSLVSLGSVNGIVSASAVVFGKKVNKLSEVEQVLLSEMYKYTYYFKGKIHEKKCQRIKKGAKVDIGKFFVNKKQRIEELYKKN